MTLRSACVVGVIVVIDQLTKFLISSALHLNQSIPVLSDIFHITLIHNSGAAFGFFKGMTSAFIILSIAVIFSIIIFSGRARLRCGHLTTGLMCILGGTIGNLLDRARLGYVVDFIDLRIWPVFNIADIAITTGGFLLIFNIFRKQNATSTI